MKTFRELAERISEYKIYFQGNILWVAYGDGSGTTAYNLDIKKYLNDDRADTEHYDDIVATILKGIVTIKPIKSKSNVEMYEVPLYPESRFKEYSGSTLDIWGGDIKALKKYYMIVTKEKSTIVNFFERKGEATAWMKSIA